jgi:uncharacterized protein with gpF-like domain
MITGSFQFPLDFWSDEERELYDATAEILVRIYYAGGMAGVAELPEWMQTQVEWEPFNQAAIDYLKAYRLGIVDGILETTRSQAVDAIDTWIRSGQRLESLIATLEPLFGAARAQRIGVTEVTRAFAAGNQAAWKLTGFVTEKRWMTAHDELVCPYCGSLAGEVVGIDNNFRVPLDKLPKKVREKLEKLGEQLEYIHPPAHVNCRCWIQPVVSAEALRQQVRDILNG